MISSARIAEMPGRPATSLDSYRRAPDATALEVERLRTILEALPVGVALHAPDGRCLLQNAAGQDLAEAHGRIVETQARVIEVNGEACRLTTSFDVTDRERLTNELFDRAYLDQLTGLPNRVLMDGSIASLIETGDAGQEFALAFIDLDNFKYINDYYSHAAGDALLVKVAQRLSSALRPGDILARIGGDEFLLLLTPIGDPETLTADIQGLSERLKDPFFIDGHEIFASASIGVSLFPRHGATYDALRRNADCAMYRAKTGVKGTAVLFEETMSHAATSRMSQEQRFRLALRDKRFCCAFQPKVDLRTTEVTGIEVLLRWRDEQGMIQPPGDFVSLATELGLINEITYLVLAETMNLMPEIDDLFGPQATISLNVAAKQADDVPFMLAFCKALDATGCPGRFMVEVTEEAFFAKSRFQTAVLPQFRAMGVKVSIDDFGVGYSSLSALADVTADEIKIDRSFITDIHKRPRSQSILKAIESLAQVLNMSIVAEGVETHEELLWLQASTRIRSGQGYYFSRPIVIESATARTVASDLRDPREFGREQPELRPSLVALR